MIVGRIDLDTNLSYESIGDTIDKLKKYRSVFKVNCVDFRVRLAQKLKEIAKELYESAWYNDIVGGAKTQGENLPAMFMTIENSEDVTALVVNNEIAIFIEFGAGVYHNAPVGNSNHPWGSELGFTIGSYPGKESPSKGQYEQWKTPDGVYTRGTEAQLVLYRAVQMLEPHIEDIAKEVFGK